MKRILIVEDEEGMLDGLAHNFRYEGYEVLTAKNGQEGLRLALKQKPDAVLLDIMLPEKDGFTVLKELRQRHKDIPVLVMTARNFEADVLKGFDLGADDYVTKPFSPREVTARVRVVLRRSRGQVQPPPILRADTLVLDLEAHTASKDNQLLDLTPTEYDILAAFMRHPGQAFTRLQLVEAAQGGAYEGYERVMDQHIKNLRAKLGDDARAPRFIETVFGVGYRFSAEFRHDA